MPSSPSNRDALGTSTKSRPRKHRALGSLLIGVLLGVVACRYFGQQSTLSSYTKPLLATDHVETKQEQQQQQSQRSTTPLVAVQEQQHQQPNLNNSSSSSTDWWKEIVTAKTTTKTEAAVVDSNTGSLFHGKVIRKYGGPRVMLTENHDNDGHPSTTTTTTKDDDNHSNSASCDKWSVVTTIFAPSDAVRRAAALSSQGWCIVIVADTKTPADYMQQANFADKDLSSIHYLSVEDQREWAQKQSSSSTRDFVESIPYRHFARKNIGYLYAIQHKAKFVFDFDDDNILNLEDNNGGNENNHDVISPIDNETHVANIRIPVLAQRALNHHPLMGASAGNHSWARGFPLDQILDESTRGGIPVESSSTLVEEPEPELFLSMDRVGTMQFCADSNPDIDAIHRLTKPLPMNFDPKAKPLLVPSRTYSPYNAQATIHTAAALWATLLPSTVKGRVSDIWRGYFAQRLYHDADLSLVFLPPRVSQDRNEHALLADMEAELDLYFKTEKLLEFLNDWQPDEGATTIPARMEALWIDLYERGYIEAEDIKLLQLWLRALVESGYEFPKIKRNRFTNILLMGQFNFALPNREIVFWVQKWREAFRHVQVRGPFDDAQLQDLRRMGVEAFTHDEVTTSSPGYLSPMSNLAKALEQQANVEGIDGVMYIHDDAMANVDVFSRRSTTAFSFPSDSILANNMPGRSMFADASSKGNPQLAVFRVLKNGDFVLRNGTQLHNLKDAERILQPQWMHWTKCIRSMRDVTLDPKSTPFREDEGSLIVSNDGQSDFLFVPTKYSILFKQAADLMVKHGVFLECGMPAIVQMLRHAIPDLKVDVVKLCTDFSQIHAPRGSPEMMARCMEDKSHDYGIYHPFKLSKQGLSRWGTMFDAITFPNATVGR